jgi:hypothetical protein
MKVSVRFDELIWGYQSSQTPVLRRILGRGGGKGKSREFGDGWLVVFLDFSGTKSVKWKYLSKGPTNSTPRRSNPQVATYLTLFFSVPT